MLIDTHCHLDVPPFRDNLSQVIAAARRCGVDRFIVPGIDPQNWDRILSLSRENERLLAAPGVHPQHADLWCVAAGERLQQLATEIVAIGEIGLDYSEGMPLRELQQEVFRSQLQIARKASLPVIIHCRKAFSDTLRILAEEQIHEFGGVMHAFSGSVETARACITLGLQIGIAGAVTWSNAVKPVQVVREIPLDHLLLETDSPDLAPEPHRGRSNEPAYLVATAQTIAAIKDISLTTVARITSRTAERIFHVRPPSLFTH